MTPKIDSAMQQETIDRLLEYAEHLRGKTGANKKELAEAVGLSPQTYRKFLRDGVMPWRDCLALLFYFTNHEKTCDAVRSLGVFPEGYTAWINRGGKS